MAKPQNPLVLDGNTVKLRIQAEREHTGNLVHVDWVRFTCPLRLAPTPDVDILFPAWDNIHHERQRDRVALSMRELSQTDFPAAAAAWELADQTAKALGPDYLVEADYRKGMDFYKWRWSITLNGVECAWVGFGSSSDSPRQQKQSNTVHVNIQGAACTFAALGWASRVADLVDTCGGVLTRADLALDFFEGHEGGIDLVVSDYIGGLCNVGGRKLKYSQVGDWANGHDRSVYIGSREAGKVTNVYEKGDQLFGEKAGSPWIRYELRYGNKLRVLTSDMLRRPDDFFSGASDWHNAALLKAGASACPAPVTCTPRRQTETVLAEVSRNVRWLVNTAASSMAVAVQHLDSEKLWELVGNAKLPNRLKKFSPSQIASAFGNAFELVTAANSPGLRIAA